MSITIKAIAILVLIATIVALGISVHSLQNQLNDANNQLSNAHTELAKLNDMCKIMQETLWRQDAAISDYIAASHKAQDANVQRIETIEHAEDACDWLDDALPASVGVLFRDACRSPRDNDPAPAGAD